MASFCKDCSIKLFGVDFGDLAGIVSEAEVKLGFGAAVICEGCGFILVDDQGRIMK